MDVLLAANALLTVAGSSLPYRTKLFHDQSSYQHFSSAYSVLTSDHGDRTENSTLIIYFAQSPF